MTRAAVVGLGLIGGSVALALEARAYDRDAKARSRARARGVETAESLSEAVRGADIVLLAVSTEEMPSLLKKVAALATAALITDTASLKMPVVAAAEALPLSARFVGGHPMAGSKTPGLDGARGDLFRGRPWLVVPTERSDVHSIAAVQDLVRGMGARPAIVDAQRHDTLMTWVSHLPNAVASAIARAVSSGAGAGLDRVAGPGLLDATRLADSPAALTMELTLADPEALAAAIEAVRAELGDLTEKLRGGDAAALRAYFEQARRSRHVLDPSPSPPGRGTG